MRHHDAGTARHPFEQLGRSKGMRRPGEPQDDSGDLTRRILGAAMLVHTRLGPGLLETVYRTCLAHELVTAGMEVVQESAIPLIYAGTSLECAFRADLIVEGRVLLELKTVERLLPVHEAQLLTYLKISGLKVGLLLNFNAVSLRQGIKRLVN